jgi:two-component system chemotaxis response regulator CheB
MDIAEELIEKVKTAAGASVGRARPIASAIPAGVLPSPRGRGNVDIVVLGISTGGPQGLKVVVPQFPADFPVPIAMVMHMPVGYTEMYARSLNELSALTVTEARHLEPLVSGTAYLAPAGRHLSVQRRGAELVAHLDVRPLDTPHRPSVDVLFQSAADSCDSRVLGAVMTGMGSDGRDGSAWIKARGGAIIAESEESCVVYGMPRSVVEAGLADATIPLELMARAIMERV